jgi:hypothetical protein
MPEHEALRLNFLIDHDASVGEAMYWISRYREQHDYLESKLDSMLKPFKDAVEWAREKNPGRDIHIVIKNFSLRQDIRLDVINFVRNMFKTQAGEQYPNGFAHSAVHLFKQVLQQDDFFSTIPISVDLLSLSDVCGFLLNSPIAQAGCYSKYMQGRPKPFCQIGTVHYSDLEKRICTMVREITCGDTPGERQVAFQRHLALSQDAHVDKTHAITDYSKFILAWLHAQDAARQGGGIVICFDDKEEDILRPLREIFSQQPHLLPRDVTFVACEYIFSDALLGEAGVEFKCDAMCEEKRVVVEGGGPSFDDYKERASKMAWEFMRWNLAGIGNSLATYKRWPRGFNCSLIDDSEAKSMPAPSAEGGGAKSTPAPSAEGGEAKSRPAPSTEGNEAKSRPAPSEEGGETRDALPSGAGGGEAKSTPAPSTEGDEAKSRPAPSEEGGETRDALPSGAGGGEAKSTPAPSAGDGEAKSTPAPSEEGGAEGLPLPSPPAQNPAPPVEARHSPV